MDFAAIDFETANKCPSSICSMGLVIVRDSRIIDSFYDLVRPEPDYFSYWCTRVHGLTQEATAQAGNFADVWAKAQQKIGSLPLVAHNARFDERCLRAAHEVYQMDYPDYSFYDTLRAARCAFRHSLPNLQLHTVAEACGFCLQNHHHALADAEACAHIAIQLMDYLETAKL